MTTTTSTSAMFPGLIFNESGQPAEVTTIGSEAQYIILDGDFGRHVDAHLVDRQVLLAIREQMEPYRDLAVAEMMRMIGKDDLFTKVMIDSSLENVDQALGQTVPEDMRAWLGMMGFRVVVDIHGQVVQIDMPGQSGDWEE